MGEGTIPVTAWVWGWVCDPAVKVVVMYEGKEMYNGILEKP